MICTVVTLHYFLLESLVMHERVFELEQSSETQSALVSRLMIIQANMSQLAIIQYKVQFFLFRIGKILRYTHYCFYIYMYIHKKYDIFKLYIFKMQIKQNVYMHI